MKYQSIITNIKTASELPEVLAPGKIVMNSSGDELKLGDSRKILSDPIELEITENGTSTVDATDHDCDGFKTVEVSVNVSGAGIIHSFTGTRTGSSLAELKTFAEACDCVGAVLWYDSNAGVYTISNGDSSASDYWNPQGNNGDDPTVVQNYGKVIAVCTGLGIWTVVGWNGVGNNYPWAESSSTLYNTNFKDLVQGSGWSNTNYIMNNYYNQGTSGTIWEQLTVQGLTGIRDWIINENDGVTQTGDLYIPQASELREIWRNTSDVVSGTASQSGFNTTFNNNIGQLLGLSGNEFWSSSQFPDDYNSAFIVDYNSGNVYNIDKNDNYLSLACLHF